MYSIEINLNLPIPLKFQSVLPLQESLPCAKLLLDCGDLEAAAMVRLQPGLVAFTDGLRERAAVVDPSCDPALCQRSLSLVERETGLRFPRWRLLRLILVVVLGILGLFHVPWPLFLSVFP